MVYNLLVASNVWLMRYSDGSLSWMDNMDNSQMTSIAAGEVYVEDPYGLLNYESNRRRYKLWITASDAWFSIQAVLLCRTIDVDEPPVFWDLPKTLTWLEHDELLTYTINVTDPEYNGTVDAVSMTLNPSNAPTEFDPETCK